MEYRASKNVKLVGLNTKGCGGPYTGLTEDGMFTDGHYAVKPTQKDLDTMPAVVANDDKWPAIDCVIGNRERYRIAEYRHITQTSWERHSKTPIDLLAIRAINDKGRMTYIQRQLADVILSRHSGAHLELIDSEHCVLFVGSEGVVVGLVMPFLYKT